MLSYEHCMWLLDMVEQLDLHPRVAKIRASTAKQEWRLLEKLIMEELSKESENSSDHGNEEG